MTSKNKRKKISKNKDFCGIFTDGSFTRLLTDYSRWAVKTARNRVRSSRVKSKFLSRLYCLPAAPVKYGRGGVKKKKRRF